MQPSKKRKFNEVEPIVVDDNSKSKRPIARKATKRNQRRLRKSRKRNQRKLREGINRDRPIPIIRDPI